MRVLVAQPVVAAPGAEPAYRDDIAVLAGELLRRGHQVHLAVVRAVPGDKRPDLGVPWPPEACLVHVEDLAVDFAFRVAETLHLAHAAPLVLFGPRPARLPDESLSRPGVEAVAVGPPDTCIPGFLEIHPSEPRRLQAPGLWINCMTGVMRNPRPPAPPNLARQATPARGLYASNDQLDAAGFAEVRVARGGEDDAGATQTRAGPGAGPPVLGEPWPLLYRTVEAVLAEMAALAEVQLDLAGFRLGGPRWTTSPVWLETFAERYPVEIGLPVRTALAAEAVSPQVAAQLARLGCEEVRIDVASGSTLIRHDVLGLEASAEALAAAFAAVAGAGIRTAARVEVGAPYETELTLGETLELLRRLDPDRVEAALHWPAPGTAAHTIAVENGLLRPDPLGAYLGGRPALELPGLPEAAQVTAREALPYALHRPRTAALIRWARRVPLGRGRTLHEAAVKPLLGPPVRKGAP